jgi:hypothetical protein
VVNKDKSKRDLGRSLLRRTGTSKPFNDNLCLFQFPFYVKEMRTNLYFIIQKGMACIIIF